MKRSENLHLINSVETAYAALDDILSKLPAGETESDSYMRRTLSLYGGETLAITRSTSTDRPMGEPVPNLTVMVSTNQRNILEFNITANGLYDLTFYGLTIRVGDKEAVFKKETTINHFGSDLTGQTAFRQGSIPLVKWVEQLVDYGTYLQPPIVIGPVKSL